MLKEYWADDGRIWISDITGLPSFQAAKRHAVSTSDLFSADAKREAALGGAPLSSCKVSMLSVQVSNSSLTSTHWALNAVVDDD